MTSTRGHGPGPQDLVERICRAVAAGDGFMLDALLAVLEAVADETLLRRLAEAMGRVAPPPRRGRSRAARARRPVHAGTGPHPSGPDPRPPSGRRP